MSHENNEQIVTGLLRTTSPASLDAVTVKQWAHQVAIKACERAREDERKQRRKIPSRCAGAPRRP